MKKNDNYKFVIGFPTSTNPLAKNIIPTKAMIAPWDFLIMSGFNTTG